MNIFSASTASILGLISALLSSTIFAGEAELLWVEPGDEYQIMFSEMNGQTWSQPQILYTSENSLTSLSMATDLDSAKIMAWSERFGARVVLMKMQRLPGAAQWSTATLFSDFGVENVAASMVVDRFNDVWLCWAANHGELADIYLLKRTRQGWSEPQKIHADNQVPDIKPQVELDASGNVSVSWQSYSYLARKYLTSNRVFELDKSPESDYKADNKEVEELSVDALSLPGFLPGNVVAIVHFPGNRMQQVVRLPLNPGFAR